uniref:Uncharacterized protein n=1 Tax=Arundo donax TaxID=35708 RepID=A0A0A9CS04_ARUDO
MLIYIYIYIPNSSLATIKMFILLQEISRREEIIWNSRLDGM